MRVDLRGMFIVEDPVSGAVTGWAVGSGGVVLRTVDSTQGTQWQDFNNPDDLLDPGSRVLDACLMPATLYDIFLFPPTYKDGWSVGENGAIAVSGDFGKTWTNVAGDVHATNFYCDPNDPEDPDDAYIVHFFSDNPLKGIIATEYRRVYTTDDGGDEWDEVDVTLDGFDPALPPIAYGHDNPANNLEWWGLDFDDPTLSTSPAYLVGGIGNQTGYMYRTAGIWSDPWLQIPEFDLLEALGVPANCSPTTQYSVAMLGAGRPVSVGYGSQIFDRVLGNPDFDPDSCEFLSPPGGQTLTWVEQDPPATGAGSPSGPGKPLFRAIAKLSPTEAVAAGGFGRIVHYDASTGVITDQGSIYPTRLNDGTFFKVGVDTHGLVTGQFLDINYTEDAGVTWVNPDLGWSINNSHQARAIAFDPGAGLGFVVGDMLDQTYGHLGGMGFMGRTIGLATEEYKFWEIMAVPAGTRTLHDVTIVSTDCGGAEPVTAYSVGELGVVLKWTATGGVWVNESPTGYDGILYGTSFVDACTGWVAGQGSKVFRTEDGGDNWVAVTVRSPESRILDIATWGDGSSAVAVGDDGGVWIGQSPLLRVDFDALGLTVEDDLYDVEVIGNGDQIWISGDNGILLHRNSSLVWSKPETRTTLQLPKVEFLSATEGYAVGVTFTILETQ